MTMLWKETDDGFVAEPLRTDRDAENPKADIPTAGKGRRFQIVPFRIGAKASHALLANADVPIRVNGQALIGGIRVLEHKDELLVDAQRSFFSAESIPVVEVYQHEGSQRTPRCPLCRAEIQNGQSVVQCPGCSRLYHQISTTNDAPEKHCWTYAPVCKFCEHPTSLSGEPTWRPDALQE